MPEVSMSPMLSWSEAFDALRSQAEAHRGGITAPLPDSDDATSFPRTTAQDVLAISVAVDSAARAFASSSVLKLWLTESDLLASQSPWTLADPYVGNRSFWSTLASVAIDLDEMHAPLPPAEVWDAVMTQLAAPAGPLRHSAGAMPITLFTAPTWAEMADRQLQLFRVLRGEERVDYPRVPIVPITRNADVLELARYWTEQLARSGVSADDTYRRIVAARWSQVIGNLVRTVRHADPGATYRRNMELWTAIVSLAQCDAGEHVPAPWAFQVAPTARDESPRNASPDGNDHTGADAKPPNVSEPLTGIINALSSAGKRVLSDALVRPLKPLLYAGGALTGGLLLYLLLRQPCGCQP